MPTTAGLVPQIIGMCDGGAKVERPWVVMSCDRLFLFNAVRAHEVTTIRTLVSTFQMPTEPYAAPVPLSLDSTQFGKFGIDALLDALECDADPSGKGYRVVDKSVVLNGFDARIILAGDGDGDVGGDGDGDGTAWRMELHAGPIEGKIVGFNGRAFPDVLAAVCSRPAASQAGVYRPPAVQTYIEGEALRLNRQFQSTSRTDQTRAASLLRQLLTTYVLPNRPFARCPGCALPYATHLPSLFRVRSHFFFTSRFSFKKLVCSSATSCLLGAGPSRCSALTKSRRCASCGTPRSALRGAIPGVVHSRVHSTI